MHYYVLNLPQGTTLCSWLNILVVRQRVYKGGMPYESRTSRKTIRLLSTIIANNRNFSGILRG